MAARTVPYHADLFYHAMVALLGRHPDRKHNYGFDGSYTYRYEPRDATEEAKFADAVATLWDWLSIFELKPLHSRCEYGRLPHPQPGEEDKDYLEIIIVHPVEKKEGA